MQMSNETHSTRPRTKVISRKANSEAEMPTELTMSAERKREALVEKIERRKNTMDRAERLAGSKDWIRNYTVPELIENFPHEPRLWSVDRYFEMADGGPLIIEEPRMDYEIERAERKRKVIEQTGIRYLVLLPEGSEADDFMELEKCGLSRPTR